MYSGNMNADKTYVPIKNYLLELALKSDCTFISVVFPNYVLLHYVVLYNLWTCIVGKYSRVFF